jgi:hypothetical protein
LRHETLQLDSGKHHKCSTVPPQLHSASLILARPWTMHLGSQACWMYAAHAGSCARMLHGQHGRPNQRLLYLRGVERPPGRMVNHLLDPKRTTQVVNSPDFGPLYVCNGRPNNQCVAHPTLVAFVGSQLAPMLPAKASWDGTLMSEHTR